MYDFFQQIFALFNEMGYIGIFLMMTIESSFIPFPSEIVMIPAGISAHQGSMNFTFALLSGTAGALFGSLLNYALGFYLGAPIVKKMIERYGKYIFLHPEHYARAEKFFQKNGGSTTFFGRFLPGIRQIISLPAGVFRMNLPKFLLFTTLGAGLWNLFLMLIGYFFADQQEQILRHFKEIILILLGIFLIFTIFTFSKKQKK